MPALDTEMITALCLIIVICIGIASLIRVLTIAWRD
jgi:hypothetical protein